MSNYEKETRLNILDSEAGPLMPLIGGSNPPDAITVKL